MLTAIYVVILLAAVFLPVLLVYAVDKKQKRREKVQLLQAFHEAGQEKGLRFSSQEILQDLVFGLDGTHRKLLLLEKQGQGRYHDTVVDLNDVAGCMVLKQYSTPAAGPYAAAVAGPHPERIDLLLSRTGKPPVEILFYVLHGTKSGDVAALEAKAHRWEAVLSKLLPVERRA